MTFSERIARTGLTHKQVGLLAVVDAGLASSQRDVAARLRVAPSLVVSLVDQLARLGTVRRKRSRIDRTVHTIEITEEGRRLLALGVAPRSALTPSFARDSLLPHDLPWTHFWPSRSGWSNWTTPPKGSRRCERDPQMGDLCMLWA